MSMLILVRIFTLMRVKHLDASLLHLFSATVAQYGFIITEIQPAVSYKCLAVSEIAAPDE